MQKIVKTKLKVELIDAFFRRSLIVVAALVAVYFLSSHVSFIASPYQNEFREGTSVLLTQGILNGVDPYAASSQPLYTNVYGILNNVIYAIVEGIVGISLSAERFISAVYVLLTLILLAFVLKRVKVPNHFIAAGIVISYVAIGQRLLTFNARPDALGLLLFFASVAIPWLNRYSWKSLAISVVLGLLAFYTKSYFALGSVFVISYVFFFKSKIKGLITTALFLVTLALSLLWIDSVADYYISNAIFTNITVAGSRVDLMIQQFKELGVFFAPLIVVNGAVWAWLHRKQLLNDIGLSINLFKPNAPLVKFDFSLWLWCILLACVVLVKMGQHTGNYMLYYFQLAGLFIIILSFQILARAKSLELVVNLTLIISLAFLTRFAWPHPTSAYQADWERLDTLVQKYELILNAPPAVSMMVKHNKVVFDSGQSEYFQFGVDTDRDPRAISDEYKNHINNLVINRNFDMIMTTTSDAPLFTYALISGYYQKVEQLQLSSPYTNSTYSIEIWLKK